SRLYRLLNFVDPDRAIYAATMFPPSVDWGIPTSFKDASNMVCTKGTSKPILFWLVGKIASMWWFDRTGYPAKRVALSVQPLSSNTSNYCKAQLRNFCMPKTKCTLRQHCFSRWMTVRAKKGEDQESVEFDEVYDARTSLKDRTLMSKRAVNELREHDIVLVEARIGRYPVKATDGSSAKGKSRAMDRWEAFYDLQTVYLIKDAVGESFASYRNTF
ncbi:hypothetical protein C8R44DRAFT_618220, partial [Mycena epipterygia]